MRSRNEELEDFKTRINLTEYAAALGYLIDRKKSYGSSVLMRAGADIVVIGKNMNVPPLSLVSRGLDLLAAPAGCSRSIKEAKPTACCCVQ